MSNLVRKLHNFTFFFTSSFLLTGLNEFLSLKLIQEGIFSLFILTLVLLLFVFRLIVISKIKSFRLDYLEKSFTGAVLGYIFFASVITFADGRNDDLSWGLRYYLPGILVFSVLYRSLKSLINEKGLLPILVFFRKILLINVLLTIVDFLTNNSLELFAVSGRYSGLISNANDAGFIFNIALVLNYYIYTKNRGVFGLLLTLLPIIAVFITFSKTAIISCLIILFVLVRKEFKYASYSIRFLMIFILLIVLLQGVNLNSTLSYLETDQQERIEQVFEVFQGNINDKTTTNRTELLDVGLAKLEEAWVFGSGFKTFSILNEIQVGVHNQYLLVWGEGGILSLVLYILLIVRFYNFNYGRKNFDLVFTRLMIISFSLYSITNHNIYFSKFIILTLALIAALIENIVVFKNQLPK